VGSTRVYIAWIYAFRDTIEIATTGGVLRAVRVPARTLSWVLTSSESIANLSIRAHTPITAGNVLTNGCFVTGVTETLVEIHTSQPCLEFKAGDAYALSVGADLVYTTVAIRTAARNTDMITAYFSGWTIAVTRAGHRTDISYTFLALNALSTGSSANKSVT